MVSLFQTLLPEEDVSRSDLGTAGYREGEVIRKEKRGVAWEKIDDQQKIPTAMTGRWQRPDGGYVLELSGIGPNGNRTASYLNPITCTRQLQ
jgi:hypothetical protein